MKTAPPTAALGTPAAAPALRGNGKAAAAQPSNAFDAALLALMLGIPAPAGEAAGETAFPGESAGLPTTEEAAPASAPLSPEAAPEAPAALLAMLFAVEPAPARIPANPGVDVTQDGAALPVLSDASTLPALVSGPVNGGSERGTRNLAGPAAPGVRTSATADPNLADLPAAPAGSASPARSGAKAGEQATTAFLQGFAPALARAEDAAALRREGAPEAPAPAALPEFQPMARGETLASSSHAAAAATAPLVGDPATPAWREGLAERVALHVRGGKTEAQISLHPADLGPIDVRIRVEDGAATLQFEAHRPETRLAIEEALPRLREMLAEGGLQLGGAHVGQRDGARDGETRPGFPGAVSRETDAEAPGAPAPRIVSVVPRGRVDLFA